MSSWCQEIKTSIKDKSTWNASIVMPTSVWRMTDFPLSEDELKIAELDMKISNQPTTSIDTATSSITNSTNSPSDIPTNQIDIMLLLQHSNHIKSKLTRLALIDSYPENAVFHFEGFNKFSDKAILIKILKQKAASTGTTLVTRSTYDNTSATDPTHQTVITCKHYGFLKQSIYKDHSFKPNTLQAAGTLIEPQHSGSSTKGNSRYRKMSRVTTEINTQSTTKVKRCHTTRCGCRFKFTISFHLKSSRWFLLKKNMKKTLFPFIPIIYGLILSMSTKGNVT
jgi:hypothetical protein